jgi:hypothetical protein
MLFGHFWVQAFDLAQQTALCWRPLWTVRGKPLPLPAVKLRRIIANIGRIKQAKNQGSWENAHNYNLGEKVLAIGIPGGLVACLDRPRKWHGYSS